MVIEALLVIAIAVMTAGALAKIYEWSQDVLYGPFIKRYD